MVSTGDSQVSETSSWILSFCDCSLIQAGTTSTCIYTWQWLHGLPTCVATSSCRTGPTCGLAIWSTAVPCVGVSPGYVGAEYEGIAKGDHFYEQLASSLSHQSCRLCRDLAACRTDNRHIDETHFWGSAWAVNYLGFEFLREGTGISEELLHRALELLTCAHFMASASFPDPMHCPTGKDQLGAGSPRE